MTPDLSLYQLALENLTTPQSLSISPVLLKSLVGAMIDVLIEEKIPATLWVKLPHVESWQVELKRYHQQTALPQRIYLCSRLGDEEVKVDDIVGKTPEVKEESQISSLQLVAESELKGESFLLVLCNQFSSLIVAAEQPQTEPTGDCDRTSSYQVVCTFERRVIQRVVEGIRSMMAVTDTTPEELLEGWDNRFPFLWTGDEKAILTQVLVKQLQRTEEIVRASTMTKSSTESPTAPPPANNDLRNKDELLRRMAQELKTPLTNMKTALSLLESPQLKPPQRQRYIQLLNTECDRQNSLIAGLLDLVQVDNSPITVIPSVELADIIPGVVSTYQPLAQEKGIQIGYTVPSNLPPVSCLETWLRQITINLLHNSLKFTAPGGQVRVLATRQGEYVQLVFSDTGIGIAPTDIPKIFESFYRGRSAPGEEMGAGLGLTIVQQLLLRCGGSIAVTSQLGKGSTFKVLFPVAPR